MEIINFIQQPRRRSAADFFKRTMGSSSINRREKNYRPKSNYSYELNYSTEVGAASFKAQKVKRDISLRSFFAAVGEGVSRAVKAIFSNIKIVLISMISVVVLASVITGISIGLTYLQNHTGPLSLNAEDSFDLESLDKFMAKFALDLPDVDAEGNVIGEENVTSALTIAQAVEYQNYKVKSGDTISGIAKKFGLRNISTLISVNKIGNVRQLNAGQRLKIPSMDGIIYTVKSGDSLNTIVQKYGIKMASLLDVNELTSETLSAGQELFIPGASLDSKTLQNAMGELFIIPISASFRWTSPYGWRSDPFTGVRSFHTGTDMACPTGTPILAAMSGRVADVGYNRIYGNYVIINHGNGYQTLYAHQSKTIAKKGQWVNQGVVVGLVGNTGYSTGPHLHFMVYKNGSRIDPMTVLRKK